MNSAQRLSTGLILLGLTAVAGCKTDGVTFDNTGNPKGGTPTVDMSSSDWNDPGELARTWDGAKVRIPLASGVLKATMVNLGETVTGQYPTVIYLHGCNGFWFGTDRRVDFLAKLGYAVIAPNSFARLKAPTSCKPLVHKGGLYRYSLAMRQFEANHAIARARELPWVDPDNLFLMGLSQGGITTATLREAGATVNARIIEAWGCHAGWAEYQGLNAPADQPVLSFVAAHDPWFRASYLQGDCGSFMKNRNSESVVYETGSLSRRHELLESTAAQEVVAAFLAKHRK